MKFQPFKSTQFSLLRGFSQIFKIPAKCTLKKGDQLILLSFVHCIPDTYEYIFLTNVNQ